MLGMGKVRGRVFRVRRIWCHVAHAFHLTTMTAGVVREDWQGEAQAKHSNAGKATAERS